MICWIEINFSLFTPYTIILLLLFLQQSSCGTNLLVASASSTTALSHLIQLNISFSVSAAKQKSSFSEGTFSSKQNFLVFLLPRRTSHCLKGMDNVGTTSSGRLNRCSLSFCNTHHCLVHTPLFRIKRHEEYLTFAISSGDTCTFGTVRLRRLRLPGKCLMAGMALEMERCSLLLVFLSSSYVQENKGRKVR